jgi:hypothetical protein
MGRKYKDLTNHEYKNYLVIRVDESKTSRHGKMWIVQCKSCGNEVSASSAEILRERNVCSTCRSSDSQMSPYRLLYGNYKRSALTNDRCWELDFDKFMSMVTSKCHYCGIPPSQEYNKKGLRFYALYNGIDRYDNNEGYTEVNSVPCCKFCNLAKSRFNVSELKSWLDVIRGGY